MFTLPNLPYAYDALEPYIDAQTMHIHHEKHHAAYVKNLNDLLVGQDEFLKMDILELMQNLEKIPDEIKIKVKNNAGGVYNHNFFWLSMTPESSKKPQPKTLELINKNFGDFVKFQDEFSKKALGRFGSGWAWLVWDAEDGRLKIEDTANQDNPMTNDQRPILALDVWEHAYYLKYQNRRAEYIANWWNVVNWEEVEKRII